MTRIGFTIHWLTMLFYSIYIINSSNTIGYEESIVILGRFKPIVVKYFIDFQYFILKNKTLCEMLEIQE